MAQTKVKVNGLAFRDRKAKNVRRRPNEIFECSATRAKDLEAGGWVTIISKKELKIQEETKELKIDEETK